MPLYVALVVVAVLSASAVFVSGYTLGEQRGLTPGTSADDQALFQPFWEAYHKIASEYVGQFTSKQLVEGSIKGMFQSLNDPFSAYMTSEEYKASLSGVSGQFEGIGAEMSAVDAKGQACSPLGDACPLSVVHVIRNSPAEKAGLKAGDVVTAVDGVPVKGSTVDATVAKVRGARNTQVKLSLLRAKAPLDLLVTRDVIQTEEVTADTLANGAVGYLKIAGFGSSVAGDFSSLLKEDVDAGIRKYVIDLRDDPGGFVDAALSVASQFVASGPVYWEAYSDGRQVPEMAKPGGLATDPAIRVAMLVNGGSASASEILAGALHDTGRATLVGVKTYGKGTIQQWIQLSNDSGGFRLSIAKWLTPNKTWIHGVGITPDLVVPVPAGAAAGSDAQLAAALNVLATPQPAADTKPGTNGAAAPAPQPKATPAGERAPASRMPIHA